MVNVSFYKFPHSFLFPLTKHMQIRTGKCLGQDRWVNFLSKSNQLYQNDGMVIIKDGIRTTFMVDRWLPPAELNPVPVGQQTKSPRLFRFPHRSTQSPTHSHTRNDSCITKLITHIATDTSKTAFRPIKMRD